MLSLISSHVMLIMVMAISGIAVLLTAIAVVEVKASFCDTTEIKTEKRVEKNSIYRRKVGVEYIYTTSEKNKISRHK